MKVKIKRISPDIALPEYQTAGSAGFDLAAGEDCQVAPGEIKLIHTGLVVKIPKGNFLLIASRSSTPSKKGLSFPHGIGVLDSDYSGDDDEILIQVTNFTKRPVEVKKGDRLAQGIVVPYKKAQFVEVVKMGKSRGGVGSTDALRHPGEPLGRRRTSK